MTENVTRTRGGARSWRWPRARGPRRAEGAAVCGGRCLGREASGEWPAASEAGVRCPALWGGAGMLGWGVSPAGLTGSESTAKAPNHDCDGLLPASFHRGRGAAATQKRELQMGNVPEPSLRAAPRPCQVVDPLVLNSSHGDPFITGSALPLLPSPHPVRQAEKPRPERGTQPGGHGW